MLHATGAPPANPPLLKGPRRDRGDKACGVPPRRGCAAQTSATRFFKRARHLARTSNGWQLLVLLRDIGPHERFTRVRHRMRGLTPPGRAPGWLARACGYLLPAVLAGCPNGHIDFFATNSELPEDARTLDQPDREAASPDRGSDGSALRAEDGATVPDAIDPVSSVGASEGGGAPSCLTDKDCHDSSQSHCDQSLKVCVQCVVDAHCAGQTETKCDRVTETCGAPCATSSDCTTPGVCDTSQGVCVECLSDAQCSGQTPRCDTQQRECVSCLTMTDCPSAMKCWQMACVVCVTDGDCTPGTVCTESHECK